MKDQILASLADTPVAAAFIYGSVAHGTATPASDIDVFVVLEHELPGEQITELRRRFHDVQLRLGNTPDPQYPVEIFTIGAVRRALAAVDPDEDQQEIRRALADRKIMLIGSVDCLSVNRLVASPVFIISSIRSGSTLLRCILGTHSKLHAPHGLHLADLSVTMNSRYVELAMDAAALDVRELEHLLWDRVLHCSLTASGKQQIIDKTPGNALRWRRLIECWPQARFVFLHRDPAQILASAHAANPARDRADTRDIVERLIAGVDDAQSHLPGVEVRYEKLTSDPHSTVGVVCDHLGVMFEESMLDYHVPERLEPGNGDFAEKIRTGRIQP